VQIVASDVNDPAVIAFLRELKPDLMLARCKPLLKKKLLAIPRIGCFVLHSGICPEYRKARMVPERGLPPPTAKCADRGGLGAR
jgi:methionyl-tRNA formyltransferase